MDILAQLGVALGFATLAGLDLYLIVFATGLAIYNGWIVLGPHYQELAILGHPIVILVAGLLYLIEFCADKIPWVDSAWDILHTAIRPIGGAFLAIRTLGQPNPIFDVIIGLLAATVTLTVHGAKSGTRLLVNASPEPFSNSAASIGEDVLTIGGLSLMIYSYKHHPWISFLVFSLTFLGLFYIIPRIARFIHVQLWLLWKKITAPAAINQSVALSARLPDKASDLLRSRIFLSAENTEIAWTIQCYSIGAKIIPKYTKGWLLATVSEPNALYFVGRRGLNKVARKLELSGYEVARIPKYLSENLLLSSSAAEPKFEFLFDRTKASVVTLIAQSIRERLYRNVSCETQLHHPANTIAH